QPGVGKLGVDGVSRGEGGPAAWGCLVSRTIVLVIAGGTRTPISSATRLARICVAPPFSPASNPPGAQAPEPLASSPRASTGTVRPSLPLCLFLEEVFP